ncbi:MAG: GNAT family N-acetyltransferase [bacterium]|nr:GNAT family N-acetyltransferase [bacterium]
MKSKYTYRYIQPGEENFVYDLIIRVFEKQVGPTYTSQGIETFTNNLSPEFLKQKNDEQFVIVAEHNSGIIGVTAFIKASHLALLFVESGFQGEGIGRALIQEGIKTCLESNSGLASITVSSSPNSLEFYKRAGFAIISNEVNENGMRFTPMQYKLT